MTRVRIRWGGEWTTKGMGKGCLLPMFVTYLGVLALDLFVLGTVSFFDDSVRVVSLYHAEESPQVLQLDEVQERGLTIRLVTNELEHDEFSLLILAEGSRPVLQLPLDNCGVSGEFTSTRWTAYGCVLVSGRLGIELVDQYFTLLLAPSGRVLGAWVTW